MTEWLNDWMIDWIYNDYQLNNLTINQLNNWTIKQLKSN